MRLSGEQLERFGRDGFLVLPELVSQDEVAALGVSILGWGR